MRACISLDWRLKNGINLGWSILSTLPLLPRPIGYFITENERNHVIFHLHDYLFTKNLENESTDYAKIFRTLVGFYFSTKVKYTQFTLACVFVQLSYTRHYKYWHLDMTHELANTKQRSIRASKFERVVVD